MRIVVAPDKYAGTLTAVEAAEAIATGWRRTAPADELELLPLSDGGPGFVDALHAALGGELLLAPVTGLGAEAEPATILRVGRSAYVESAQVLGRLGGAAPYADRRSSGPLGQLIRHAVDDGATRIVVGVGGTLTSDGGAGVLAALGAGAEGGSLDAGYAGLDGLGAVDLAPARRLLAGIQLVAATDVDNPLTGLFGAAKVFGAQKGLSEEMQYSADAALQRLAELTDRATATLPGAGAGGGVGFALLLLGGTRRPGLDVVADAVGLDERIAGADLVLTGEGSFDASSRGGKVPVGVAARAGRHARPCVVLAGRVGIGAREHRSLGVDAAYSAVDLAGEEQAMGQPGAALADLAERVARTWSHAE